MIIAAGIRISGRENQQEASGDQEMPIAPPDWNQNDEGGQRHMNDYCNLIFQGKKEATPRGQNVKKTFEGQQGKEETPAEWLGRLRRNVKQYSRTDSETITGQALLRVNFFTHAWPDISKMLKKIEDRHDKPPNDL